MQAIASKLIWLAILTLLLPVQAAALTLFSSFGVGDSYNPTGGVSTGNQGGLGMAFTPFEAALLGSIDFAGIEFGPDPDGTALISVWSDAYGHPDVLLESVLASVASRIDIYQASFSETVALEAGVQYWATIEEQLQASESSVIFAWSQSTVFDGGTWAFRNSSTSPWLLDDRNDFPAFQVHGTLVPEPATGSLLALGLVDLVVCHFSRS